VCEPYVLSISSATTLGNPSLSNVLLLRPYGRKFYERRFIPFESMDINQK
jgi:hypothetical protein